MNEDSIFYVFVALFDWVFLSAICLLMKAKTLSMASEKNFNLPLKEQIIFTGKWALIAFIPAYLFGQDYSRHGVILHTIKLVTMFVLPVIVGCIWGFHEVNSKQKVTL